MADPAYGGRRAGSGSNSPAAQLVRPKWPSSAPSRRLRMWNQSSWGCHWRNLNEVSSSPGASTTMAAQVKSDSRRVARGVGSGPAVVPADVGDQIRARPLGVLTRTLLQRLLRRPRDLIWREF